MAESCRELGWTEEEIASQRDYLESQGMSLHDFWEKTRAGLAKYDPNHSFDYDHHQNHQYDHHHHHLSVFP